MLSMLNLPTRTSAAHGTFVDASIEDIKEGDSKLLV